MPFVAKVIKCLIALVFIIPWLIISYIFGIIPCFVMRKMGKDYSKYLSSWTTFSAHWILFFLGVRRRVTGIGNVPPAKEKVCFIINHSSIMDIVMMLSFKEFKMGFIGKVEVKKIPIVNAYFDLLGSVYMDRKSPRDSIKAILNGSEHIKNGTMMAIFPEGTRSKDGKVHEMKAGSFKMATRAGAKIVPVAIKGTRGLAESITKIIPDPVYVSFLPAVDTATMSDEEKNTVHEKVETMIRDAYGSFPPAKRC